MPDPDAIPKAQLLADLGYGGDPSEYAGALAEAGLSNPRKANISPEKAERVESVLAAGFRRVCRRGDCRTRAAVEAAHDGRTVTLAASQGHCEICGGSANAASIEQMLRACRSQGWTRLVVVGGSPNTRAELERLVEGRIGLRLISGTQTRRKPEAKADLEWADRVVLWAGTQLDHKVSDLYKGPTVIASEGRGIEAVAYAVVRSASGGR